MVGLTLPAEEEGESPTALTLTTVTARVGLLDLIGGTTSVGFHAELGGGGTIAPGYYHGFYQDPDTGERVADKSKKYVVAIPEQSVGELKALLSLCCVMFAQKCIYLSIAGRVEFLKSPDDGQTNE